MNRMQQMSANSSQGAAAAPKYEPHIQLVPVPLWGWNMRRLMPQTRWAKFRKALIERQGQFCATCGKHDESRKLSAHEKWQYVENGHMAIARLANVSLVCWHCHHVEHWGVTKTLVAQGHLTQRAIDDTIAHFCRLNNATEAAFMAHEKEATNDWSRRSGLQWRVDYGPFFSWVFATYARDPFNQRDWSAAITRKWGDREPPTMEEIVDDLDISIREQRGLVDLVTVDAGTRSASMTGRVDNI